MEDHSMHDMGNMPEGGHNMHMMKMFFNTDFIGQYILFEGWQIESSSAYIGSLFAVFTLAILFEALESFIQRYEYNIVTSVKITEEPNESLTSPDYSGESSVFTYQQQMIRSLLMFIRTFFSYSLMMVFMTFDVGLCLVLTGGAAVGLFLFSRTHNTLVIRKSGCRCG